MYCNTDEKEKKAFINENIEMLGKKCLISGCNYLEYITSFSKNIFYFFLVNRTQGAFLTMFFFFSLYILKK